MNAHIASILRPLRLTRAHSAHPGPVARGWLAAVVLLALLWSGAAAAACQVSAAAPPTPVAADGGTVTVAVLAAADCGWASAPSAPWISHAFLSDTAGTGAGQVSYMLAANPGPQPRSGAVVIGGTSVVIVQSGQPCAVGLAGDSVAVTADAGVASVGVGAACPWTARIDASWIRFAYLSGGSGSGNDTVYLSYSANPGAGTRRGTVVIGGQTFTVVQAGIGAQSSGLLVNAGFESGKGAWVEQSSGGYVLISGIAGDAHGGAMHAWLGGYADGIDTIYQNFQIPADAQGVSLQFWYRIGGSETGAAAADRLDVEVYDTASGARLAVLGSLSNVDAGAGWRASAQFDLSAYRGKSVRIKFTARNDAVNPTYFHLDDIAVTASYGAAQAAPGVPVNQVLTAAVGWNLFGNGLSAPVAPAELTRSGAVASVWAWRDASKRWALYLPGLSDSELAAYAASQGYEVLTSIAAGSGFWVEATAGGVVHTLTGGALGLRPSALARGWSLVASGADAMPAELNGGPIGAPDYASLWAWDGTAGKWLYYAPALAAQGGTVLRDYALGHGYLDFAASGRTLAPGSGFWIAR